MNKEKITEIENKKGLYHYNFKIEKMGNVLICTFDGDFSEQSLLDLIFEKVKTNLSTGTKVIFDFEKVTYFHSYGFGSLMDLQSKIEDYCDYENNIFSICNLKSEYLKDIFELIGISVIIKITKNLEEGLIFLNNK